MARKAWFESKGSGLGMRPASWQGWLLAAVLFAWIAAGLGVFARGLPHDNRFIAFGLWVAGAAALLYLMRARTGPIRS